MIETPIQDWNVVVAILFSLMAVLLLSVFLLIKVQISFIGWKKTRLEKSSTREYNLDKEKKNE